MSKFMWKKRAETRIHIVHLYAKPRQVTCHIQLWPAVFLCPSNANPTFIKFDRGDSVLNRTQVRFYIAVFLIHTI